VVRGPQFEKRCPTSFTQAYVTLLHNCLAIIIFDPMVIMLLDLIKIGHFLLVLRHSSIHNLRIFRHRFISDDSSAIPNACAVDDRLKCASTTLGYPHFNYDIHP